MIIDDLNGTYCTEIKKTTIEILILVLKNRNYAKWIDFLCCNFFLDSPLF